MKRLKVERMSLSTNPLAVRYGTLIAGTPSQAVLTSLSPQVHQIDQIDESLAKKPVLRSCSSWDLNVQISQVEICRNGITHLGLIGQAIRQLLDLGSGIWKVLQSWPLRFILCKFRPVAYFLRPQRSRGFVNFGICGDDSMGVDGLVS